MLQSLALDEQYNNGQEAMIGYLKSCIKDGKRFFKSKNIARDLGMKSREVGTNIKILSKRCPDFRIEKWSYTKSTTWLIECSTKG